MKKIILIILILLFIPLTTYAHPGRTNSEGCHTCKKNCPKWGLKYGQYHCHKSKYEGKHYHHKK